MNEETYNWWCWLFGWVHWILAYLCVIFVAFCIGRGTGAEKYHAHGHEQGYRQGYDQAWADWNEPPLLGPIYGGAFKSYCEVKP